MADTARGVLGGASLVLIGATPLAVGLVTREAASPWLICGIAAAQVGAMLWLLGRGGALSRVASVAGVLGLLGIAVSAAGLPARVVGLAASGGCHAVAYGGLLAWFAASLRPGREPVVTGFARRMRRSMPDRVVRYTRQVTMAWCVFFAFELLVSAGLLLLAPERIWSGFANLANLPLIAAMMLAEFGCRLVLFRHEPRTGLLATLAGLRQFSKARP